MKRLKRKRMHGHWLRQRWDDMQAQAQVSEQTTELEKLVEKLEELGKIDELRDNVQWLKYLAMELKYYAEKDASMFIIENMFKLTNVTIIGKHTGCAYFNVSIDPKNMTISDLFDKFFSANIYVNALKCITDALNELTNIIDSALPEREEDP